MDGRPLLREKGSPPRATVRIWDLPPRLLCRGHLLGEHRELHAVWTILTRGKRGYARHPETLRWAGKTRALYRRHQALVREMLRRAYRHASPLDRRLAKGSHVQRAFVDSPRAQRRRLRAKGCPCRVSGRPYRLGQDRPTVGRPGGDAMTQVQAFVVGTLLSFAVAVGVLLILRKRLTAILTELCDHENRCRFWVAMVNVTVALSATLLSMTAGHPPAPVEAPFWSIVRQLEYAFGGMIASLVVLAIVIGKSITRFEERTLARGPKGPGLPGGGSPRPAAGSPA